MTIIVGMVLLAVAGIIAAELVSTISRPDLIAAAGRKTG
jgi:hypothetical protein